MDLYNFQNIKAEKAKAMLRYRRMQKVTIMFRFIEFCIFLIVFSKFSFKFPPAALKLSGDYFRGLSVSLISPRFVFIVGNTIVIFLFLKSGRSSEKNIPTEDGKLDLYDEYVKKCERDRRLHENNEDIKKQGEDVKNPTSGKYESLASYISGSNPLPVDNSFRVELSLTEKSIGEVIEQSSCTYQSKKRKINRTQSESWSVRRNQEEHSKDLRRSVTVACRKSEDNAAAEADRMSSEEFRRTVEAFIARQQRFLREEEFSVFVPCEN